MQHTGTGLVPLVITNTIYSTIRYCNTYVPNTEKNDGSWVSTHWPMTHVTHRIMATHVTHDPPTHRLPWSSASIRWTRSCSNLIKMHNSTMLTYFWLWYVQKCLSDVLNKIFAQDSISAEHGILNFIRFLFFFVHIEQGSVFHEICDSGGDMFDRFVICFKAYVEIRVWWTLAEKLI